MSAHPVSRDRVAGMAGDRSSMVRPAGRRGLLHCWEGDSGPLRLLDRPSDRDREMAITDGGSSAIHPPARRGFPVVRKIDREMMIDRSASPRPVTCCGCDVDRPGDGGPWMDHDRSPSTEFEGLRRAPAAAPSPRVAVRGNCTRGHATLPLPHRWGGDVVDGWVAVADRSPCADCAMDVRSADLDRSPSPHHAGDGKTEDLDRSPSPDRAIDGQTGDNDRTRSTDDGRSGDLDRSRSTDGADGGRSAGSDRSSSADRADQRREVDLDRSRSGRYAGGGQ